MTFRGACFPSKRLLKGQGPADLLHRGVTEKIKNVRILWLKTELLHPVDKGGKIRTYNMLKQLKLEHDITYLALDDGTAPETARADAIEYCHKLILVPHRTRPKFSVGFYGELLANLFSQLPYFMKKYESQGMRQAMTNCGSGRVRLLVCEFLQPIATTDNLPSDTVHSPQRRVDIWNAL